MTSGATSLPPETGGRGELALAARGIGKSFDGKPANKGVDFAVRRGEIHALLGENGAGKTTLISILCGQYQPDAGEIEIDGVSRRFASPRDALRAGIGVVHQDLRQVERFTVTENVVLGTRDRAGAAAERRVKEVAAELGFELDPGAVVARLSVGERQQLEIVKLLYRGLSVLILDEPTAVLAPQQSEQLFRALRRLADDGKAVVFISHRLREVTVAADFVTVLRQGRVVAQRPVAGAEPDELAELMVGDAVAEAAELPPSTPAEPVLELERACCGSGRGELRDVDLTVRRGEIVGVAGVSGNGQVLLAELAAGMVRSHSGIRRAASDVIAFIPEDRLATGLVGRMSIAENLSFRRFGRPPLSTRLWLRRRRLAAHAEDLVEEYGIPAQDTRLPVARLSGGGLQRVIVAREMSETPDLLVAAQPTRGLDVVSAGAVRGQLLAARGAGAGVLLVSEDLDELLELSDRVVVMLRGCVAASFERDGLDRAALGRAMAGAA